MPALICRGLASTRNSPRITIVSTIIIMIIMLITKYTIQSLSYSCQIHTTRPDLNCGGLTSSCPSSHTDFVLFENNFLPTKQNIELISQTTYSTVLLLKLLFLLLLTPTLLLLLLLLFLLPLHVLLALILKLTLTLMVTLKLTLTLTLTLTLPLTLLLSLQLLQLLLLLHLLQLLE
jgi:hypothetical protein